MRPPILSISGSDSTNQSGIGADIQTIAALGGEALTAITCVDGHAMPTDVVLRQVASIISDVHPKAIKVGLVTSCATVGALRREVIACRRLVVAPGIFSSEGRQMVEQDVIEAIRRHLVPEALLLMLRCKDAEKMLGTPIRTDDDMLAAARRLHEMGAQWVLLRGKASPVSSREGEKLRLTALLYGQDGSHLSWFSSYNTDGWQRHGVGGALSAAITVRLGMGDDVPTAIRNAHDYIHSQVVYAKEAGSGSLRAIDIYNSFVSLVAEHYATAHDVAFYADRLCITPRYLSQATDRAVGKPPRQIIADYLTSEARSHLATSRLTIQQIALRLGFSSQAQFCRFFRKEQGLSPSDFRSQLQ